MSNIFYGSSIAFHAFLALSSFGLIFGIEPFPDLILNAFIISLFTYILSIPIGFVVGVQRDGVRQFFVENKKHYIATLIALLFLLVIALFSSLVLFKIQKSPIIFIISFLQIFFFLKGDILENKGKSISMSIIILFAGLLFGWGIFNMLKFLRAALVVVHIGLPLGDPIIGTWGLIFYSWSIISIVDKENKVSTFLSKKSGYIFALALIMIVFIILGGSKQHL